VSTVERQASGANRGLLLIGAGIVGLLLITIVVVILAGNVGEADIPPGSPQAAIQAYLAAFEDDNLELAHGFFSNAIREQWSLEDYRRSVEGYGMDRGGQARRVLFDRADETDGRVRVHLTVEEFYGDGLSGDVYRSSREIRMVREEGAWRLDQRLVWLDQVPSSFP
jgi:hypothetical protein